MPVAADVFAALHRHRSIIEWGEVVPHPRPASRGRAAKIGFRHHRVSQRLAFKGSNGKACLFFIRPVGIQ
jgi:hypothetical protein